MSEGTHVWIGRVERKVRRKRWIELSLKVPDVEKTQTLMVMKPADDNNADNIEDEVVATDVQHDVCLLLEAMVRATVIPDHYRGDGRTWRVQRLELLECPPIPLAVKKILESQVPKLWETLKPYEERYDQEMKKDDDDDDGEEGGRGGSVDGEEEEEDYSNFNHAMVKRIILRLQRRQPTLPRIRPPRIGPAMIRALEEMEQQVELIDVRNVPSEDEEKAEGADQGPMKQDQQRCHSITSSLGINLPQTEDDRVLISAHHKLTRLEYLESKKHPQVTWFLQRLLRSFSNVRHILDVGGGRGDLAIALAMGLGQYKTRVTVVDMNESSLEAGRKFAEECGVGDRMEWICTDFESYVKDTQQQSQQTTTTEDSKKNDRIDMVVALHACGYLSDLALEYAVRRKASFMICPCCYSKMRVKNIATKMAEISEAPEFSRRGMHIINSQRYWNLMSFGGGGEGQGRGGGTHRIVLEEYSRAWSSRNMVLIGWPLQES